METDKEKFRVLIYAKDFDEQTRHKLLRIVDSSMVIEDLLDLIKEETGEPYYSGPIFGSGSDEDDEDPDSDSDPCETCEFEDERDESRKDLEDMRTRIINQIILLQKDRGLDVSREDITGGKTFDNDQLERKLVEVVERYLAEAVCRVRSELE